VELVGDCSVLTDTAIRAHAPTNRKKPGQPHRPLRAELLLKLNLQSNPEALCLVRATMERATEVLSFPESESRAIVRSVDEALANVIRHAYRGRTGLPIEVTCSRLWSAKNGGSPQGIEILLKDAGVAADPRTFKGRPLNEIRPGGLGIHFMKQSMDVVEFQRKSGKNTLRMVKYLAPQKSAVVCQGE